MERNKEGAQSGRGTIGVHRGATLHAFRVVPGLAQQPINKERS